MSSIADNMNQIRAEAQARQNDQRQTAQQQAEFERTVKVALEGIFRQFGQAVSENDKQLQIGASPIANAPGISILLRGHYFHCWGTALGEQVMIRAKEFVRRGSIDRENPIDLYTGALGDEQITQALEQHSLNWYKKIYA